VAQRRDITGWVDLSFTVTTNGEVADIEIMDAEPRTMFNDAATKALEQWRFEPALRNGQPVEKRIALRLSFNLQ
jgi:protein TonB